MANKTVSPGNNNLSVEVLSSPMDQPIPMPQTDKVLQRVEDAINYAITNNDPDAAIDLIVELTQVQRLSGLARAKGLWILSRRWVELGIAESFYTEIYQRVGLSQDTVRRYIQMWDLINDLPERGIDEETIHDLMGRPTGDLIAIAQAESRHGKFTKKKLAYLSAAADGSTLRERIQKAVSGKEDDGETTGGKFVMLRRNGTLEFYRGKKKKAFGFLNLSDAAGDEDIQAAIDYLVERASIKEEQR